jgi:hypothetical protein
MGAALERDERVLTGESGGSRHLRKGSRQVLFLKAITYYPHLCNRIRAGQKEQHQEEITDGEV